MFGCLGLNQRDTFCHSFRMLGFAVVENSEIVCTSTCFPDGLCERCSRKLKRSRKRIRAGWSRYPREKLCTLVRCEPGEFTAKHAERAGNELNLGVIFIRRETVCTKVRYVNSAIEIDARWATDAAEVRLDICFFRSDKTPPRDQTSRSRTFGTELLGVRTGVSRGISKRFCR